MRMGLCEKRPHVILDMVSTCGYYIHIRRFDRTGVVELKRERERGGGDKGEREGREKRV